MNQSFAFEFLCENFQPKLINSYSNFKRFFHFLFCDLGYLFSQELLSIEQIIISKYVDSKKSITDYIMLQGS
jgi:hypothetical protein